MRRGNGKIRLKKKKSLKKTGDIHIKTKMREQMKVTHNAGDVIKMSLFSA